MNLRLHKEYGVNPTIPVCFVCGEKKKRDSFTWRRVPRKGANAYVH